MMAFAEIKKYASAGGSPATNRVSINGIGPTGAQTDISFSADVAARCGLVKGGRASIAIGTGPDAGRVLIASDSHGDRANSWAIRQPKKSRALSVAISTSSLRCVPTSTRRKQCSFTIEDGALIVDLPAEMHLTDAAATA